MAAGSRWQEYGEMGLLHLPALEDLGGVKAFFTGRTGGASLRWNRGLNWSYSVGDDHPSVRSNRARTLAVLGIPLEQAVMAGLVHGNRVVAVTGAEDPGLDEVRLVADCDALTTDRPGIALVVTAADCVPVLLYDPVRRVIGAAHAGWRGTVAGVASRTAQAMASQYGCVPEQIRAVIGPSIGPCCFEVDEPVVRPLRAHFGTAADDLLTPGAAPDKYQLDLWAANRLDLLQAGLTDVIISGECTVCKVDRFFSHRAEQGTAGRGAAVIVLL